VFNKEYYVTNILSNTDLIITGGLEDGFNEEDTFTIIDPNPEKIIHPITGELLDTIERYKDKLVVKSIKNNYTILTTRTKINGNKLSSIELSSYRSMVDNIKTKRTINVDKKDVNDVLSRFSYKEIYVGDVVTKD